VYPADLKYHSEHSWAKIEGAKAKIGISDYAQQSLGDIVYLELPAEGDEVKAGESIGEVESTKAVSKVYSPLSGKVTAVNQAVVDAPESINEDPYESWMIEVELSNPAEADDLADSQKYESTLESQA
jgi:glycine cleavage system H protein